MRKKQTKTRQDASPSYLNWIELDRSALNKNLDSLARLAGARLLAVSVKANAYGHGLPQIIEMVRSDKRVEYVTVHSVAEAELVRKSGWERRIMLLGPFAPDETSAVLGLELEPMIFEAGALERLGRESARRQTVINTHLKLETGTNRQGIDERELPQFAAIYKKYSALVCHGAAMHFANIEDTTNHEYAQQQLDRFKKLLGAMKKAGLEPKVRHTASSAALILFDKTRFELVRPGLSLYGYWPSKETYLSYRLAGGENNMFSPVLSWKTRITQLKAVPADSFIGYGCTYRTTTNTRLAILPVGYYDGYSRSLSNLAYVLIRGKRAPVRGRICMNLMMVDVTDIKSARVGDEVTLIGRDGAETLSADQLADWANSINYEILARLGSFTIRKIVGNG